MVGRIIEGPGDIAEGMGWLAARDSRFADAYALTGPLPLRRKPEGFAELLSAIVSQQVSVASARAIWARVEAAGLITKRTQGRQRLVTAKPETLAKARELLNRYEDLWRSRIDRLDSLLADQP